VSGFGGGDGAHAQALALGAKPLTEGGQRSGGSFSGGGGDGWHNVSHYRQNKRNDQNGKQNAG
jgi:hypothetical protein